MPSTASSSPSAPSTAAQLLAEFYPPLARYWPHLKTASAPQAAFLCLPHREAFYGGAAGGGKSDALLAAALQYVDVPGYAALLLRRTYPELEGADGLIAKAHEWLGPHRRSGGCEWNEQKHRWTFPSGAVLQFGHVKSEVDKTNYQGQAYQFVGFDELTHFSESIYDYIAFTRSRRDLDMKQRGVPIRARSASNPGGVGHGWVKKRFLTEPKPGVVFIPAKLRDNPGLDADDYEASFADVSAELRKQLLDGDWDAFENQAFTLTDDHLVDDFPLDDAYDRFEAADYGLNGAPWALVPTDFEGNVVFFDMLYERDLLPSDLAALVVEKRKAGWGHGHTAYVDPSVWHRTGQRNKWGAPAMLADEFTDNGVQVMPANNDPRAGLIRLRELLELDPEHPFPNWHRRAGELGAPRVFFVRGGCPLLVDELRSAPLQPIDKRNGGEIVDPEWESRHGHAVAMARYAVMEKPDASVEPPVEPDDERERMARRMLDRARSNSGLMPV